MGLAGLSAQQLCTRILPPILREEPLPSVGLVHRSAKQDRVNALFRASQYEALRD